MGWLARRRLRQLDTLVTGHAERNFRMGLVFNRWGRNRWTLLWRMNGGFGYRWLSRSGQQAIVNVWNPIMCRWFGHDELDEGQFFKGGQVVCMNCSKVLR